MIELTVNGKARSIQSVTLLEYLAELGVRPEIVAVEYNGDIIRRESYGETRLKAGDVVEIVRMVGGGRL